MGINIVANYVSPAYDLANVAPKHIDFKRGGLMMADYFRVKRGHADLESLYIDGPRSQYWYRGGWNLTAIYAFVPAATVAIVVALVSQLHDAAAFSWFIGAGIAAGLYLALMSRTASAPVPA
jgi:NCS1 family nucleobase:cation symporter-1